MTIRTTIASAILGSALLVPAATHAAELLFNVVETGAGDGGAVVVEALIDPQSKKMNAVEGTLVFSGAPTDGLDVQIENGQSILPIWPTPPVYDAKKKTIAFTGGVPNGFDAEGLLFRVRLTAAQSGTVRISYVNGTGYLNDGKGTSVTISAKPLEVYVHAQESTDARGDSSNEDANLRVMILLGASVLIAAIGYGFKKFYYPYHEVS